MRTEYIVRMLKALSDPTRLRIYLFLRNACCGVAMDDHGDVRCDCGCGRTVGDVCCNVLGEKQIPSSLSFHLKELKNSGLIQMERKGKNIFCSLNRKSEAVLQAFFQGEIEALEEENNGQRINIRQV